MGPTYLSSKAVQGPALALQSIDNVEGCDSLTACMLSVCDCIPDDILEEDLQDSPSLLIDETRDTLDASTASQSADGGLCDALDVVPKHLPVPFGTSFSCMSSGSQACVDRRYCFWIS